MNHSDQLIAYARQQYSAMLREPEGLLSHPFLVPGSVYHNSLWDWDSWFIEQALAHISQKEDIIEYEKGCLLNFFDNQ